MATYRNYNELVGKTLRYKDVIYFTVKGHTAEHTVELSYINARYKINSWVFDKLGVDKQSYCTSSYGYKADNGTWPESKSDDYTALTRLALKIYADAEGKSSHNSTGVYQADLDKQYQNHYNSRDKIEIVYMNMTYKFTVHDRHFDCSSHGNDSLFRALGLNGRIRETIYADLQLPNDEFDASFKDFPVLSYGSARDKRNNEILNLIIKWLVSKIKGKSTKVTHKYKQDDTTNIIIVPKPVAKIERGPTIRGRAISGRPDKITVTVGRINYKAIADKS